MRLAKYFVPPEEQQPPVVAQGADQVQQPPAQPARPTLPENVIDAPLVRLHNFLREFTSYYCIMPRVNVRCNRNDVPLVSAGDFTLSSTADALIRLGRLYEGLVF